MEKKKLLDVCHIQYGLPFDSSHFTSCETDMPLIRIRDVKEGKTSTYYNADYPEEYIVRKGEYLIGMDGEFNIAPWNSQNALLNQRVCKVTSKTPEVSIDYVFRFLTKELKRIEDETPFVTVKHLSAKRLNQVFLPLPPLTTQQQIVSELDLLSHILDQKRQQLKEYDALAESIFYDMFGDPMENPKGWEMKKLGELFKVTSSKRILQEEWSDFGVPFLKVADLVSIIDGKKLNPSTFIPEAIFSKLIEDGNVPKEGDILVTSRGTIGHCYIVKSQDRFYFQDGMITWLSNNKGLVIPIYIVKLFQNKEFLDKLTNSTNKSTVSYLSIGQISKKEIPLPPLTLQRSFAAKIESIEHQKQLLRASIKETEMLFQSRMDYWFNG